MTRQSALVTDPSRACCVFAHGLTRLVYGDIVDRAPVDLWHLYAACRDPWGPVSAVALCGLSRAPVTLAPERACYVRVQAWGLPGDADRVAAGLPPLGPGHTFTVYRSGMYDASTVMDSTLATGAREALLDWPTWSAQFRGGMRCIELPPF